MASATALKFEPTHIHVGYMKTERYPFGTSGGRSIDFNPPLSEEPDLLPVPAGIAELVIQARMCGDFYAMVEGPQHRARSVVAPTLREAVTRVFAA